MKKTATVLEKDPWEVFETCDEDFTGTISKEELKARFVEILGNAGSSLGDKELDAFLDAVDADRNGFIDHDEWTTMVRGGRSLGARLGSLPRGVLPS